MLCLQYSVNGMLAVPLLAVISAESANSSHRLLHGSRAKASGRKGSYILCYNLTRSQGLRLGGRILYRTETDGGILPTWIRL